MFKNLLGATDRDSDERVAMAIAITTQPVAKDAKTVFATAPHATGPVAMQATKTTN